MKEKIYTIPVTDAFKQDCECPVCVLEKDLEDKAIEFILGPSLMEPDKRDDTTEKGFCRRHLTLLYNAGENLLGLSLILNSHMEHQIETLKNVSITKPKKKFFGKNNSGTEKAVDNLDEMITSCEICDRIDGTMEHYLDVITYLYFKEDDFRKRFKEHKGFCLPHLKLLLKATAEYLKGDKAEEFAKSVMKIQVKNMQRIYDDTDWFIKKFDYRFQDKPWKNSKDALPRGIQKLVSYCELDK